MDEAACNFNSEALQDDGSCQYALDLHGVDNVDCDGVCLSDVDGDGVCDEDEISGCTDPESCNYNEAATDEDNSCTFDCYGCMDLSACNYDETATFEDGSCLVSDECGVCGGGGIPEGDCDCDGNQVDVIGECGGECVSDFNGNGICDVNENFGCTYPDAINYDEEATVDDGSCIAEECDVDGIFAEGYAEGFSEGAESVSCPATSSCPEDLDNNGVVAMGDLLIFLQSFGQLCELD